MKIADIPSLPMEMLPQYLTTTPSYPLKKEGYGSQIRYDASESDKRKEVPTPEHQITTSNPVDR